MDKSSAEKIASGIEEAMRNETDGYHFYMMAASSTQDMKGKVVFTQLAEEELMHLRFLSKQKQKLLETGEIDPEISIGERTDLDRDNPIFSKDIKKRAGEAHYEMSALSIGAQLELKSLRFYKEQARNAEDKGVKKFYEELAAWESGHYEALNTQMEELKEDYWNEGGFSPL